MKNIFKIKKILTFAICLAITAGIMSVSFINETPEIEAQTVAELQEQKEQNQGDIDALEDELAALEENAADEAAYQETLSKQIQLMQDNLRIVDEEITRINNDITEKETNIQALTDDIAVQEVNVADNIELFKQRLRAMYVTGNDSLASAVIGATDFYDMLSRVEMVNRIAEHDNELIETLKTEITTLETSKSNLETEKLDLEMQKEEQASKKDEYNALIDEYNTAYQKSQDEIDRIAMEAERTKKSKEELEAENAAIDAAKQELIDEIVRKQQAAKEKADADRKAAEEAAAEAERLQNESNNSSSSSSTSSDDEDEYESGSEGGSESGESTVTPSSGGFSWPAPGYYYVSSEYGYRWGSLHAGLDIAGGGIQGASACASQSGTVIAVSTSCTHNYAKDSNCCGNGYGNYVVIDHDGTYSTLYGHLESVYVSVGDYVSAGQAVGAIGCTGFSTGFHLHFEIRVDGSAVNPRDYL